MSDTIESFARQQIKDGLALLNEKQQYFFKRMYSFKDLDKPINDVVDEMPEEKLSWAWEQVENTLDKEILP